MKRVNYYLGVVLICCLAPSFAGAQGFRDILKRLDALEARIDAAEKSAPGENDVSARLTVLETAFNTSSSRALSAEDIEKLEKSIDGVRDDLDRVVAETIQLVGDVQVLKENTNISTGSSDMGPVVAQLQREVEALKGGAVAVATPEEETVESSNAFFASVDPAFMSRYVWRGILFNDEPVFQPSVTVGMNNLSLNVWSNMDLTDRTGHENEAWELDFTLDYSSSFSIFSYSAGYVRYTFPHTAYASTTELYLILSSVKTGNLSVSVFQDVGSAEGTYCSLGNGMSVPLGSLTSLDISGSVNWGSARHNNYYYAYDGGAVTDANITLSATFGIGAYVSVTPSFTAASLVNESIREGFKSADIDRDNFIGGLAISAAF